MKLHPKDAPNSVIKGRHKDRLKQTVEFVRLHIDHATNILCIGDESVFDKTVADGLDISSIKLSNTCGDLDSRDWTYRMGSGISYRFVFCFEVLEHLLNPLLFLKELSDFISHDAIVFISVPNHLLRRHWRTLHYHEIDPVRFEYLCEQAGYEIVDHVCHKYYPILRDITGIRPFIRYITGYSWFISRVDRHFYALKHIK